ncbi:MAG: glycosyltransferase, partial [Rhodothermales bacterium]
LTTLFSSATFSTTSILIFTGFFFGSVQLLFLGIIGIYLIRVYGEVKVRPRYIISSVWHSEA